MLPSPPPSPLSSCMPSTIPEARLGQLVGGHIQLTSVLGVGAYGTVYKAIDVRTGTPHAVKALGKIGLEPRQRMFQQREISLHSAVSAHPNIVAMTNVFEDDECIFYVMEFCPEGDLFAKITEEETYSGNDFLIRDVFVQILNAVEYCHSLGVYHRDLKPENVLVTNNGRTVKLADFGLATREYYNSDFGCGSTFYMSPECQQTSPPSYACYNSAANDVWSLGVILVNLACGRNPWKRASLSDSTYKAYIKDRSFLKSILPISDELDLILRNVFEPNPNYRCTASQLKYAILNCSTFSKHTPCAPQAPLSPAYTEIDSPVWAACPAPIEPQQQLDYQEIALAHQLAQLSTSVDYTRAPPTPPLSPKKSHAAPTRLHTSCGPSFVSSAFMPFYANLTNFTKHGMPPRMGLV